MPRHQEWGIRVAGAILSAHRDLGGLQRPQEVSGYREKVAVFFGGELTGGGHQGVDRGEEREHVEDGGRGR